MNLITKPTSLLLILLLLAIVVLSSCSREGRGQFFEKSIMELLEKAPDNQIYLVMEQQSCNTCLYKADRFFNQHRDHGQITYVFAGYHSKKHVKLKYGLDGDESNILFDEASIFFKNNVQLKYPSILYFENGSITEHEVATSDNFSAYDRLEGYLGISPQLSVVE